MTALNPHTETRQDLVARWAIRFDLITASACQIGSTEGDASDTTYQQDEDGGLILTGSSLCGALRSAAEDALYGYRTAAKPADAEKDVDRLFGSRSVHTDDSHESRVTAYDCIGKRAAATSAPGSAIRDGVKIGLYGVPVAHAKYDREVALPGFRFPVRIDVVITRSDAGREPDLMACLATALESIHNTGDVRLGASKSRGLGACQAEQFKAVRYNLTTADGWQAYADSGYQELRNKEGGTAARKAIARALGAELPAAPDRRRRLDIVASLNWQGTLIIRAPSPKPQDADAVHLHEAGKPLITGTSVAGVLRSQCLRILNTLQPSTAEEKLCSLFGTAAGDLPTASRIYVDDTIVQRSQTHRHKRNSIDRFTGATRRGALFDEQPLVGGSADVNIVVRDPQPLDSALVFFALRDLVEGFATIGGGAGVGRGRVEGKLTFRWSGVEGAPSAWAWPPSAGAESAVPDTITRGIAGLTHQEAEHG